MAPASMLGRSVRDGDPVTIIVNRAYIPADAKSPGRTRDIAVLLDLGMRMGQDEQFVAVWYQRDVPADELLSFQDLVVYNEDSWDKRVPPYFHMRLIDVSTERNTATAAMLDQVAELSGTLSTLVSSPWAGTAMSIGLRAAKLVLANTRDQPLVDYTFQLFSQDEVDKAGGMPLGLFRTGGLLLMGQPTQVDNSFWAAKFRYDHRLRRVQKTDGTTVDSPFLLSTVMTAEVAVPTIVKRRSERIAQLLADQKAVRNDLSGVIGEVKSLQWSLEAMNMRESFYKLPSKESFGVFLEDAKANWDKLPKPEQDWLLRSIKTITQVNRATIGDYATWYKTYGATCKFDADARRFMPGDNADVKDKSPK